MGDRVRLIFGLTLGLILITLSVADGVEISASQVRAIIESGQPAEFDNYTIVGDLNLSSLKIVGPVHFNHTLFQNSVNFNSTIFKDTAYFRGSAFNGDAYFWDSAFNGPANFEGSTFNGTANFVGSAFNGTANFVGSAFNGDAYFVGTAFNGPAFFVGSAFDGPAFFVGSAFNGYAYFMGSRFNVSDFSGTKFNKETRFGDAKFARTANFDDSRFTGDAVFENTDFESKLSLTRARYDKLYVRWHNITGGLVYDDAAYMSLMKNFKDLGYFEDYDSCYFQYRKEHRSQPWPTVNGWEAAIRKVIDYPLEWFYGYGTKPLNAFLFSLGIIISFGGFWRALGLGGPKDRTKEGLKEGEEWLDGDITDILGFSVTVFLSGTKFFIDPPAIPKIEGHSRSLIKKAFVLERLLGALFSILFFIAVSGTIVRAS
jgi:hypothetical protein